MFPCLLFPLLLCDLNFPVRINKGLSYEDTLPFSPVPPVFLQADDPVPPLSSSAGRSSPDSPALLLTSPAGTQEENIDKKK